MFRSYDSMMKNATATMAGSESTIALDKRDVINEMDRLMNNPLELYLRWFRYGKLVYLDNRECFQEFLNLLQDQGEIGLATVTLLTKQFESEYEGYGPSYFGKASSENGEEIYLLVYPCTRSGENINFNYFDADYGISAYALNMNKPNKNAVITAFFMWDKDGYICKPISYNEG